MTFKVGDKVICIGTADPHNYFKTNGTYGSGWQEGLVFTITKITGTAPRQILWGGYNRNGVFTKYVAPYYLDWEEVLKCNP
jgi:hypothetical protein